MISTCAITPYRFCGMGDKDNGRRAGGTFGIKDADF